MAIAGVFIVLVAIKYIALFTHISTSEQIS